MSHRAAGLQAWLLQRITAGYLMLFFPALLAYFLFTPPVDAAAWRSWVSQPGIVILLSIGLLSLLMHTWVGVRDILIDYVHPLALRISLLALTAFGLLACGIWGLQILLTVQP